MADRRPFANPFYGLLIVVGVAFLLTAISYGLMAFREVSGHGADTSGSAWMLFLDRHGGTVLMGEVLLLVLASLAAMATDRFWTSRADRQDDSSEEGQ